MRADVGWSTTTLNLILAALYASDARAKEARSTYDAPVASDRNAKLRAAERLFDRAERDPRTCAPPDCATYTIALRARARRGDLDGCRQAFRSLRDSPTLSVDNVAATSMLVALARAGALSEMWRLLEDMRNVEMCEDLPTPDADAVEVVVRALARARSGVAADKASLYMRGTLARGGDLGCALGGLRAGGTLACARKAPPPKGLFDLKRSVRDDVKAAREVLDGLEGRLPSDTVRDLRQYARLDARPVRDGTCATARASGPEGGGRARVRGDRSSLGRLLYWNSVDSGFKPPDHGYTYVLRRSSAVRSTTASFLVRFCCGGRKPGESRTQCRRGRRGRLPLCRRWRAAEQRVDEGDVGSVVVVLGGVLLSLWALACARNQPVSRALQASRWRASRFCFLRFFMMPISPATLSGLFNSPSCSPFSARALARSKWRRSR